MMAESAWGRRWWRQPWQKDECLDRIFCEIGDSRLSGRRHASGALRLRSGPRGLEAREFLS